LRFANAQGEVTVSPQATVLALGGASWPKLGSDGAWASWLGAKGITTAPFESANCGLEVNWSAYLRANFAGTPLKSVALAFSDRHGHTEKKQGELVISEHGVEGSLIYAFSGRIREAINTHGSATFELDLAPGRDAGQVLSEVSVPRGSRSLSSHLKGRLGITGVKLALLHEVLEKGQMANPEKLATAIKSLPITVTAPRPISEAISTAGGLRFEDLDENLMIKTLPGVFAAGEMLDWEAPTGGYLLTACFATGSWAGAGVQKWLNGNRTHKS